MSQVFSAADVYKLVEDKLGANSRITDIFKQCFSNTLEQTIDILPDGSVFVVTGDIPAMWLRDSAAQFRPYLVIKDEHITGIIRGSLNGSFTI